MNDLVMTGNVGKVKINLYYRLSYSQKENDEWKE